jgi:hypothetical protein
MAAWKPLMGVWKSDTIKFMQQELLDEQRWRVGPGPPRNGGMISVAFVVVPSATFCLRTKVSQCKPVARREGRDFPSKQCVAKHAVTK